MQVHNFILTMFQKKTGQISLFLLIGVLLLGVTIVVLLLLPSNVDSEFLDRQASESANTQVVLSLIQSCLDTTSEQALFIIGMQGGNIYTNQPQGRDESLYSVPFRHSDTTYQVGFGLKRRFNEIDPPYYPFNLPTQNGFAYTLSFLEQNFRGASIWGQNTLPKLCSRTGPNAQMSDVMNFSCEVGAYGGDGNTIQDKLARYIREEMKSCLVQSSQSIQGIVESFIQHAEVSSVLLGDERVDVTYTLDASVIQTETTTQILEIQSSVPARLKRVYNLAYYMIQENIQNISFDLSQDYPQIQRCSYSQTPFCWDANLSVNILRNRGTSLTPGADIIEIIDSASNVKGNPYRFLFSVENRRPMLEYMDFDGSTPFPSLVTSVGEQVVFQPVGYDPDQDRLRFSYSGWLADELEDSDEFRLGTNCEGDLSRCAAVVVPENGTGIFELQISVSDEWDLHDYQPLSVRVYGRGVEILNWNEAIGSCPAQKDGFTTKICHDASCVCEEGEYCIDARPQEDTQLECRAGSTCCSYKESGDFELTCIGPNTRCSATSNSNIELACTNRASCELQAVVLSGICRDSETNCVLNGDATQVSCDGVGVTCDISS